MKFVPPDIIKSLWLLAGKKTRLAVKHSKTTLSASGLWQIGHYYTDEMHPWLHLHFWTTTWSQRVNFIQKKLCSNISNCQASIDFNTESRCDYHPATANYSNKYAVTVHVKNPPRVSHHTFSMHIFLHGGSKVYAMNLPVSRDGRGKMSQSGTNLTPGVIARIRSNN